MENRKIKILAIDDNQDNLISIKALIKEAFPEVLTLTAINGKKGIELAAAEDPDVILLDIIMPDMDGFEVCKKLKADIKLSDIPVVFVTALKGDQESRIRALESGAEAFLAKPIDTSELTAQIRAMVKIKTASIEKRDENQRLQKLVEVRTEALQKELKERKLAEVKLKESELKFRTVADYTFDWEYWQGADRHIIYMSPSCYRITGYTASEFISNPELLQKIMHPDDAELFMHHAADIITVDNKNDIAELDFRIINKDGTIVYINHACRPVFDENNNYSGRRVSNRDITERKQSEAQLRKLSQALEQSPASIVITNLAGEIEYVNPKFTQMTGYTLNEARGQNPRVLKSGEQPNEFYKALWETISAGKEWKGEFHNKKKNGEYFWEAASISPIVNEDGKSTHYLAVKEDITERKLVEQKLKSSESRAQAIINSSPVPMAINNELLQITFLNPAFTQKYGYEIADIPTLKDWWLNAYPNPEYRQKVTDIWATEMEWIKKTGDPFNPMEFTIRCKNGTDRTAFISATSFSPLLENEHLVMFQDITEYKLAEEKIRKKDVEFRKLSSNLPDLIYQFTRKPDGTYFVPIASEGIRNIFGCSPEDVLDDFAPISSVIYPDDAARVISDIEYSAKHLTYFTCEFRVQIPGKEIQWIFSRSTPEKLPDGSITWYGFNADITDRKRAEKELQISESNYKTLFNENTDGITIFSVRGDELPSVILDMNRYAASMLGYSREEMIKIDPKKLEIDITPEMIEKRVREIKSKGISNYEAILKHKNGDKVFVEIKTLVINYANQPAVMNIARDITKRKQVEQELILAKEKAEENETKYREIFDNTFDIMSIYEVTEDGRFKVITFNAAEEKLIGSVENYENRYIDDCITPELYNQFKQNYDRCIAAEKLIEYEEDISFMDINKTFHTQLIPLKNSAGRIHRIIVISRDITDIKLMNNRLINQNETLNSLNIDLTISKIKAEESDRLKTAFLKNLSHEIRTPMNGILGFSSLLSEPGLEKEEQQDYFEIIQKASDRMLNIISEIVDISKIETGEISVYIQETNINEKIENVFNFLKPVAETKRINLSFKTSLPDETGLITTDREKLHSILANLVKNAIKYTDKGSVEFGYVSTGSTTDSLSSVSERAELQFYVKDTGIGIPKDRQEAIFERFIQADIADVQARQGAGLGLSIAKAFVEMLGGKIWVESEVGVGSTFYFTLPYNIAPIEKTKSENGFQADKADSYAKNLKILIVEDDEISELYLNEIVNIFGKEILTARTGIEAVEVCKNNPDIDLILMDIQLPELSGYKATEQIRQFNKDVIIIAQTAFGLSGDREKAINAGCNDYITKPINKEELLALIQKELKK